MRRIVLPGLLAALAVGLFAGIGEAWAGGNVSGNVGRGGARFGSPFPGPPLGERQNEAWGRYLLRQKSRNNPPPPPQFFPQYRNWAWIAPAWQWNGFRWVWVPGYWAPQTW